MKNNIFTNIYIYLVISLCSCAIIKAPEGGPKDITPPKVKKEIPPNYNLNFKSDYIQIILNKYIQAKNLKKDIIITPLMSKSPDFVIKNNRIIINLKDTLKINTTYQINFGESISDIHEGNILKNYKYIFSTGNFLDTAEIKGTVYDAYKQEPLRNIKIMLFLNQKDSVIFRNKPYYYSISDSSGNFDLKYIKPGDYRLFAIDDNNDNNNYDVGEKFGFINKKIDLNKEKKITDIKVNIYKEENKNPKLVYFKIIDKNKISLFFDGEVTDISIKQKTSNNYNKLYFTKSTGCDSFIVWYYSGKSDSNLIYINYNKKDTIIHVYSQEPNKKEVEKASKIKIYTIPDLYKKQKCFLLFSEPIIKINMKNIIISRDTIKDKENLDFIFVDSSYTLAYLNFDFRPGINYSFIIPDSVFKNIYNYYNDTFVFNVNTKKENELGSISLNLILTEGLKNAIVELIDKDYNIIRQKIIHNSCDIIFDNLLPDVYIIRVIDDENGNNKWDPGIFAQKIQPEKIYYYPDKIILKANWEVNDLKFTVPVIQK